MPNPETSELPVGSDALRLDAYCASDGCSWAGDYDETTWSLKDDTGQIVECSGEDPRGERCCPHCLLTNLMDTEGWDDAQLPNHAFRLPNDQTEGPAESRPSQPE